MGVPLQSHRATAQSAPERSTHTAPRRSGCSPASRARVPVPRTDGTGNGKGFDSRKGFMNQNPSHYPCHLCGELEHAHEMRVNIQNGAALCACCVLEHFEPWRDDSEAERP